VTTTSSPRNARFYIHSILTGWYSFHLIGVKVEPRDIWVGLYWTAYSDPWLPFLTNFQVYVCLLPMMPIIFDLIEVEP